ncbi:MAG: LysM protein [Acidimicrobiaceae bacterium]|nr:LysM protein [Acidimicrobiaceae bacterium]
MAAIAYPYLGSPVRRRRVEPSGRAPLRLIDGGHRPVQGPIDVPSFVERAGDRRMTTRSRVAARRRRVAQVRATVLTAGLLMGVWLGAGALSSAAHPVRFVHIAGAEVVAGGQRYIARPGDTLWSIATRLDPSGDPRPVVDQLAAQIHGSDLQPGTVLQLP